MPWPIQGELALWVLLSFALYTVTRWLLWSYRHQLWPAVWQRLADGLLSAPYSPWLLEGLRFAFYVGLPYAALMRGVLGLDLLGMVGGRLGGGGEPFFLAFPWETWVEGVGVGVVLSLGGGGLWLLGRRSLPPCSFPPLGIRLRDAFYDELHWAFYRALPLLLFASRYTGTFAGAGLVLLEALLDPHVRWQLRDPDHNPYLVLRGLTWVVSLLLFLATGNLWLSGLVHLLLVWKLA